MPTPCRLRLRRCGAKIAWWLHCCAPWCDINPLMELTSVNMCEYRCRSRWIFSKHLRCTSFEMFRMSIMSWLLTGSQLKVWTERVLFFIFLQSSCKDVTCYLAASRKPEVHSDHCQRAVPCNASSCPARRFLIRQAPTVMQAAEFGRVS